MNATSARHSGPPLVACTHGTRDASGRAAVDGLRAAIGERRPGLTVVEAYVDEDVQQPGLATALADLETAVVVPILLSGGYHVHVDVRNGVAAGPGSVVAARPLGPDPVLVDVLVDRLNEAGAAGHVVILAAAGSTDRRAQRDVEQVARGLADRLDRPVQPAYATASEPRLEPLVADLRARGQQVALAAYLLAPGHFERKVTDLPAEVHTSPLLPDPRIAELVLRRYDEAVHRLTAS